MRARRLAAGLTAAALALHAAAAAAHRAEHKPVGARPAMDYVPPAAGTYPLHVIQAAPEGTVIDAAGRPHALSEYTRGRVTLLSLIYTYCTEPTGCALAYDTQLELGKRIVADPALHGRARFVSLSFDPLNDGPETMRLYGGRNARNDGPLPWHFLTTRSVRALQPILESLGQDIAVELDERGRPTRTISHMLKLFLIDRDGRVREIYSTEFLHPEAMLNDLRTLIMEEDGRRPPPGTAR
jgi:cytochrome oxidase Cu insertion factor (SCO1/SenC/PrrC family)